LGAHRSLAFERQKVLRQGEEKNYRQNSVHEFSLVDLDLQSKVQN
jgi:hypothetical protein